MIVVGERINATRSKVADALGRRDEDFFRGEAQKQSACGADFIDVNCGGAGDAGCGLMQWLVRTLLPATPTPLCIDSSDPDIIRAGLAEHADRKPMVNSTTADEGMMAKIMGLYPERPFHLIVLAMDGSRIPSTPEDRLSKVAKAVEAAERHGIPLEDLFVDPLVQPVSCESHAALTTLRTLSLVKERFPGIRSVAGVSNVSFGLPGRSLLNRTMLSLLISRGLDAAIIDPSNVSILSEIRASETLLGVDEMCLHFIQLFREGKIAP